MQALAAYACRKNDLVGRETGKLKEATNVLNATLSSMNLPAALEDTSGMFCKSLFFVCFRGSEAFFKLRLITLKIVNKCNGMGGSLAD